MKLDINFPPDFQPRYGYARDISKHILAIFSHHNPQMNKFVADLKKHRKCFSAIPLEADAKSLEPRWFNGWFPSLDCMTLYHLLAERNPATYVEIGSGNSTKFARRAIKDHHLRTRIISIDPEPRTEIDAIADEVIRSGVEFVDISLFSQLDADSVVFFDGSHRSFQNSDVTVFFIDILPELKAGIDVGVHDVLWPWDYPPTWVERYYNEQYMLGTYMLAFGRSFPLIFSCAHAARTFQPELAEVLPEELFTALKEKSGYIGGSGIWFKKPAIDYGVH
ncbi:class I SAM-dependent methyltransferase [Phyllobacterium myrsinacearum]|uniref:Class I SAM-dependent methyltransferase n=1 Tax=Phyllobacterium myrsinacearum TaxID=28101 RepID=A0A839ETV2_9HYPH|nr:class I SAM-dependent methyltransferase [Phyllobacterium myrsinacearum]MBA8880934.1 hypothetical protein [Phyllobacterium myrsinacearum]